MHRRQRAVALVESAPVTTSTWGAEGERVLAALVETPVRTWTETDLARVAQAAGVTGPQVGAYLAEPGFAEELWERTRRRVLLLMPAVAQALLGDALGGDDKTARSAQKLLIQMAGVAAKSGPSTLIQNVNAGAAAPSMSEDELRRIMAEYETL